MGAWDFLALQEKLQKLEKAVAVSGVSSGVAILQARKSQVPTMLAQARPALELCVGGKKSDTQFKLFFSWQETENVRTYHHNDMTIIFLSSGKKKEHKDKLFGSGDRPVGWGSSTRRGGGRKLRARPRKFVFLGFRREESGMSREFCRDVPDPWGCSKSLCKKTSCALFVPYVKHTHLLAESIHDLCIRWNLMVSRLPLNTRSGHHVMWCLPAKFAAQTFGGCFVHQVMDFVYPSKHIADPYACICQKLLKTVHCPPRQQVIHWKHSLNWKSWQPTPP